MKQTALLLVFFFLFSGKIQAQCPPEGITLSTQAEIDAFSVNYPDCTHKRIES